MAKPAIESLALDHLRSLGLSDGFIRMARTLGVTATRRNGKDDKELTSVRTRAAIQILYHCDRLKHTDSAFHGFELARAVRAFHDAAPTPRTPRITTDLLRKLKGAGCTAKQAQDRLTTASENGQRIHGFDVTCQGSVFVVQKSGKTGKISTKHFAATYAKVAVSR